MITIDYSELRECIEMLERSARLVNEMNDVSAGEAIDNIYEVKTILQRGVESFEEMMEAMSDDYDSSDRDIY